MSDKLFRWLILLNLTAAVGGGLIIAGLHLTGRQQPAANANQYQHLELGLDHFTRTSMTQMSSGLSYSLNNISKSQQELAQAQKELAAAQKLAAENGRYQQVQTPGAIVGPVQFFDTRTGVIKPAKQVPRAVRRRLHNL